MWQPNCRCRCIDCLAFLIHWAISKHISLTMSTLILIQGGFTWPLLGAACIAVVGAYIIATRLQSAGGLEPRQRQKLH